MEKRSDKLYLKDIIDSIVKIREYTKDLSFEDFSKDNLIVDAVVRNFEIIGEATKHIPYKITLKYKTIPWKEMAGMRDKIIHEYFGVDLDIVWKTIDETLPKLILALKKVYNLEFK